jgi:hypothetical protein
MKPYCITFAGPFGCSKSPVAQYLSCALGCPSLANDVIRNEVREDQLSNQLDQDEYFARVTERIHTLVEHRQNFIHDASSDRLWDKFVSNFGSDQYRLGIISFDLSPAFYRRLIAAKQYPLTEADIDRYLADHQTFMERTDTPIILRITDDTFATRLTDSVRAVNNFLQ